MRAEYAIFDVVENGLFSNVAHDLFAILSILSFTSKKCIPKRSLIIIHLFCEVILHTSCFYAFL